MPTEELALVWRLRRVLHALEPGAALELLTDKIRADEVQRAVPAGDREGPGLVSWSRARERTRRQERYRT